MILLVYKNSWLSGAVNKDFAMPTFRSSSGDGLFRKFELFRFYKEYKSLYKGWFTLYNFCLQLSHAMRIQLELYNVN
jgi:hypothetical protein